MSVIIENLTKVYGNQIALNNISFKANKGEILGFLGPNGAGKSTCMKILCGFLQPTSGATYVNGISVQKEPLVTKRLTGYLPEHNPLYSEMYIKEFLFFMAGIYGIEDPKKRVEEIIELVGLEPEKHKKIKQLSKGYKQRVGIAQALIHDPEVIVLDEPTSGLDPLQLEEIRNLIKELGKNKTVILSTHIMQEVVAICDRVILIRKGEIVLDKPMNEIGDQLEEVFKKLTV